MQQQKNRGGDSEDRPLRALFSPKPSVERMLAGKLQAIEAIYRPFTDPGLDPHEYDLVVPLRLDAVRWLHTAAGSAFRRKALLPSPDVLALCDDKLAFARHLIDAGDNQNVPTLEGPLAYPYILKGRVGEWGARTHLIDGPAAERQWAAELDSPDYFRQACIPGHKEYATHMLVVDTHVMHLSTVCIEFHDERTIFREGVKPVGFSRAGNTDHIRLFAKILVRLGYEGLCCFDYKIEDGIVKIFELNPRFGGSLGFTPNGALRAYAQAVAKRTYR